MANRSWLRVSRAKPCPVCEKPDWCMVSGDGAVAVCCRIESHQPMRSSTGWLHRLRPDDDYRQSLWRRSRRPRQHDTPERKDLAGLARRLYRAMTDDAYAWLSDHLGVSVESLHLLRVGWSPSRRAYSFPMRSPDGQIVGIRYRSLEGAKYSETGGHEGLFFQPSELTRDYLIVVEGASDTAAMMTMDYRSVIGRANCVGNASQIVTLYRRLMPRRVVIVPDNDEPGISGAESLASILPTRPNILHLPQGIKDVRACIAKKENADWLRSRVGILSTSSSTNHGGIPNDCIV
jgi:hypothetical protein